MVVKPLVSGLSSWKLQSSIASCDRTCETKSWVSIVPVIFQVTRNNDIKLVTLHEFLALVFCSIKKKKVVLKWISPTSHRGDCQDDPYCRRNGLTGYSESWAK